MNLNFFLYFYLNIPFQLLLFNSLTIEHELMPPQQNN